jgi:hypothetical protein
LKSTFKECAIAGAGAILYAVGLFLSRTNPAIPYLFAVLSTVMIHNTAAAAILQELRKSPAEKENRTIRKNCIYLFSMLFIYWVMIFILTRFMHL